MSSSPRRMWSKEEENYIVAAVHHVRAIGGTWYQRVQYLHKGPLAHRSWQSIWCKFTRYRKQLEEGKVNVVQGN